MTFGAIWEELEQITPTGGRGRVKRRVKPEAKADLFLAISKPSNLRMMLMLVGEDSLKGLTELPSARGVAARIARPGEDGADAVLELVLTDPRSEDIFTALATDIAETAGAATAEADAVAALVSRMRRWQRFLEEASPEGLDPEHQRGLYAELWLLRHYLLEAIGRIPAIRSWTGPAHADHDFQLGKIAFEVKGATAKQHQMLRIASERQLDSTAVDSLFLFHLSLDAHLDTGQSLPTLLEEIRDTLGGTAARTVFEERLFDAGYLDVHRHLYENPGYTARESNFFRVGHGFPRIVESDLRAGVGDVRYSIAVAECKHFLVDSVAVMEEVRSSSHGRF